MSGRTIFVEKVCRIEGGLNFTVVLGDGYVVETRAEALEGIRLLERFLRGRDYGEVPDIASRMCGVCQAIHRITAVQAIENAFGISLPESLQVLRRLVAIGGLLQSHILHLYIFVLPDFLGYSNIVEMLPRYEGIVRKVLKLKKLANVITEIIGGRAVHPITPIVGGFSKIPSKEDLENILRMAKEFRKELLQVLDPILSLEMPEFRRRARYISVYNGERFPLLNGMLKVDDGSMFEPMKYMYCIQPIREEYSTAKHYLYRINKEPYMVGALSRLNLNHGLLSDSAKDLAKTYGLVFPDYSPFSNNKAQVLELVHFADEAIELAEKLLSGGIGKKSVVFRVEEGEGISATEAPRGLLIHHYKINKMGRVVEANIVTPTAQNLKNLEMDAKDYIEFLLEENNVKDIKLELEKLIRSYDPCISCSARFLKENTK